MIYIKTFVVWLEGLNESHIHPKVTNDKYWVEVSREEFRYMYFEKLEEMSFKNKEKIKNLLGFEVLFSGSNIGISFKFNEIHISGEDYIYDYLYIAEIEDDYFIVSYRDSEAIRWYYKCDQFEGLVQLFKNLKFI